MSTAPTTDDTDTFDDSREYAPVLVGRVVHYTDEPDEFTLFPRDADGMELLTNWITAAEGSWIDLDSMC